MGSVTHFNRDLKLIQINCGDSIALIVRAIYQLRHVGYKVQNMLGAWVSLIIFVGHLVFKFARVGLVVGVKPKRVFYQRKTRQLVFPAPFGLCSA